MSSYTNIYPSATTVIGYTFNGDTYCRFCAITLCAITIFDTDHIDLTGPIFHGSEWDYVPTCGACGEALDGVTVLGSDYGW